MIINTIISISEEFLNLSMEMAPYLLIGFLLAGLIKVFIRQKWIRAILGKNDYLSVLYASVIGIPIPICSCGIIPVAMTLDREGSSRGATLSFLISTPDSGADSLLATYSLLGLTFTIVRTITTTLIANIVGLAINIFDMDSDENTVDKEEDECPVCEDKSNHKHTIPERIKAGLKFAFITLVEDVGKWLILGILIGAVIIYFVPDNFVDNYLPGSVLSYLAVILFSIPLYVCATGSIPIALALMMKGFSPGTALVFLIVGPATNTVTLTVLWNKFGKRAFLIFIIVLILGSVALGYAFDTFLKHYKIDLELSPELVSERGTGLKLISTIILFGLIVYSYIIYPLIKRTDKGGS